MDVLSSLCGKQAARKCKVRVIDTIYIDPNGVPVWLLTTKSGAITRRKVPMSTSLAGPGTLSEELIESIKDRFAQFALANPHNVDRIVGVLSGNSMSGGGSKKLLDEDELVSLLHSPTAVPSISLPSFLQVYLRPYKGTHDLRLFCQLDNKGTSPPQLRCFKKVSSSSGSETVVDLTDDSSMVTQMKDFTNEVFDCLSANGVTTQRITIGYTLDDNEHVWVSEIPDFLAASKLPAPDTVSPRAGLPLLTPTNGSLAGSSQQLAHGALLDILSGPSSVRASSAGSSGSGGPASSSSSSSSEILIREGNNYRSVKAPEELPGLRAWVLASVVGDHEQDMKWTIDLTEYDVPSRDRMSPNAVTEDTRRLRAQSRHTTSWLLVNMIKIAERLLLGQINVGNKPDDFVASWLQVYQQAQQAASESTRQGVEVNVCGNTFAICRKLQSLIAIGFKASQISSDSNGPSQALAASRPRSHQGSIR
jgi:hypothetical protein